MQIEDLYKNQISVTYSVMTKFKETFQKRRTDGKIFNRNLKKIEKTIRQISYKFQYVEVNVFRNVRKANEKNFYLEETLNDFFLFDSK